jgi:2-dehydropantoate 2-reductase
MASRSLRNICIYGAGALGGSMAAKLAAGLREQAVVSVVARGAHLESIRQNGLRVFEPGATSAIGARITATADPGELPSQDLVITGLKGHQLAAAAPGIAKLLHSGTRVVMILNGIPWWYFHRDRQSNFAETQFEELDPGGVLWHLLGPERVIGCVAYQGAEVINPGEIKLSNIGRYVLGEPSDELSPDIEAISALMTQAGLNITISPNIRNEIWNKLLGNAAFNPISALTRALMSEIMADPGLSKMVAQVMTEVRSVGQSLGAHFALSIEERVEQSKLIGPVRTSMLQDLLAGKSLEITPLVGMVVSLGRLTGVATPTSETILSLVSQLDRETQRT